MRAFLVTLTLISAFSVAIAQRAIASPSAEEREMWKTIKAGLLGADGDKYYAEIRGALLPKLSGKVTSVLENEGVSKVVVAITDDVTPEVTLIVHNGSRKLAADLKGKEVSFEGVVDGFTEFPFMLTLDLHESTGIIEGR